MARDALYEEKQMTTLTHEEKIEHGENGAS
jgi:hypothetical protein